MRIEVIVVLALLLIGCIHEIYLKKYYQVRKVFKTLHHFLDVRDSLVVKLLPEVKGKKVAQDIIEGIDERKMNFSSSQNNAILSDIKLNTRLKKLYEEINHISKNEIINQLFANILSIEKDLKRIRKEYNLAVEEYNQSLVKHKVILLKVMKMKPLDTYQTTTQAIRKE